MKNVSRDTTIISTVSTTTQTIKKLYNKNAAATKESEEEEERIMTRQSRTTQLEQSRQTARKQKALIKVNLGAPQITCMLHPFQQTAR